MLFNSFQFIFFFFIVLAVYYIIPKKVRWIWLLVTSYIFYMGWNVKYVTLLFGMTLITYILGLCIAQIRHFGFQEKLERYLLIGTLITAIVCNIGLLIYFKYMDMIGSLLRASFSILGIEMAINSFDIMLPVGISFISFQSLGYVIDIYKGKIQVEKNFFKYALFVAFFPQLVAGPIERSDHLLSQIKFIHKQRSITYEKFTNGFILMLFGYFQKIVIGDKLKIFVDAVFEAPNQQDSLILAIGAVAFAIQIYCDFGGYSNIAIGAAQVLGFDMMENFNTPYFSKSIKEFWGRWHISLSTWFRDYVYFPLGGGYYGTIRKYINLMITFIISGLWHGAHGHYVVWGMIHGGYRILEDAGKQWMCGLGN